MAVEMKPLNNTFFIEIEKEAWDAACKLGINLIVQVPEWETDVGMQLQTDENLIQRKVDVICVSPSGSKVVIPVILEEIPGHETGTARMSGFHAAVDNAPGIQIVTSETANFGCDKGYNVFQNILESNPDVQALFACHDIMALGAVEAIATPSRTGQAIAADITGNDRADRSGISFGESLIEGIKNGYR